MFDKKQFNGIFIFMALLTFISYFSGFFIDVTRDCGKYATVAKEIFENGNFINLTIHGDAYDQKPPLLFWLGVLGFYVGGISNFWFKFPVFLVVLMGIYSTYRLAKSMYNKSTGQIAAIMLFFSVIYSLYSMDVHTDTPVQAFVAFAMWQLYDFIKTGKNSNWIMGFIGIGLAMLSKGPMGAVVPAFAVVGHILLKKEYHLLKDPRWYLGIVLSFVIVSPALIGLYSQFGIEGIKFFFWDNNIGRLTGSYITTSYDPTMYIHSTLYLFVPWSVLLFIAAFQDIKSRFKNRFVATEHFTFTGIWVFFIILSSSRSMLPNYIFILIPLMAVLTAKYVDEAISLKGKLYRVFDNAQTIITITLWIALVVLATYFFPTSNWQYWAAGSFLLALTYYVFKYAGAGKVKLLLPTIIAYTAFNMFLNMHIFPYIFSFQAPPKAARIFNKEAAPGDKLYNYKYGQYELFFYSEPQALQIHSQEELEKVIKEPQTWIFTNPAGLNTINRYNAQIDTIYSFEHLYLNNAEQFILPSNRKNALKPMYLVKLK
ncbi:hypothetical protein MNBD_BACTEROID01-914 [hydrothermal vent metagenome]|uniref:Glycosyltransferase RgtA/B/C/D-like domain-containing protein n=1 Tax=hydrothermal vent metagenome TaxID=652676 RepID=A0A3B0TID3_9ZZZZ